jgi:nucleoid-associated protein YgaU
MSKATIFSPDADSPDFKPALTLGQGMPREIDGEPCAHFWKEVLRPRRFLDAAGIEHNVTPERIAVLASNFRKLAGKGKLPTLPSHHPQAGEAKDALTNLGHVIDAKVNDGGGLEVLCRFVGVDAIRASARNAASIGTMPDFVDADGERYNEILDHVAIVPDPRLTDLNGFQPALAASSGPAVSAVVVSPAPTPAAAPNTRSIAMPADFAPLRKALSLADTVTDEQVIAKAAEAVTNATATLAAEKARADAAETAKLELSNSIPRQADPEILKDRMGVFSDKLDNLMERNKCTPQQKEAAMAIVAPGGQPAAMMLSQSVTTGPASAILKLLELANTNPFGQKSDAQPVGRTVPGGTPEDKPITPARKAELLAHVGA